MGAYEAIKAPLLRSDLGGAARLARGDTVVLTENDSNGSKTTAYIPKG
jgi:hypothetical protein